MPRGATRFFITYSVLSGLLAVLDIIALSLLALVAASLANRNVIEIPGLGLSLEINLAGALVAVSLIFVAKSMFAMLLFWWATRRFAHYELEVGNRLFQAYLSSDWEERSKLSTAEITRIVDVSMDATNQRFILQLTQLPGYFFTFIAVLSVFIIIEPVTALLSMVYLFVIFLLIIFIVLRKMNLSGTINRRITFRVANIMTEMVGALKELTLQNKTQEIANVVSYNRKQAVRARADIAFFAIVPKYTFEIGLIGGFLVVGATSFFIGGAESTILSVSLFAATGFRMIPALYGIQTSLSSASASQVYAQDVINQLSTASGRSRPTEIKQDLKTIPDSIKLLKLRNVSYSYPGSSHKVLDSISLDIELGKSLAFVGPSGSGKSTLVDILLGLLTPTSGKILLDDLPLTDVLKQWRSMVGFVPQKVTIFNGSIAQNVALTWENNYDRDLVISALRRAHLEHFLKKPEDIETLAGENGDSMSGGQQQRLGIARALYSKPIVMVMDEATSALDTSTENLLVASMSELRGDVTFITVAHRLASIRNYDQVCYLDQGRILGIGTFEDLVSKLPEFAHQAKLAGLS
jgi:ABC-type multidrug transport system fused ATPase/permease subunit